MKKIKYLEGLRGVAALIVFFCHLFISVFPVGYLIKLYAVINNCQYIPLPFKYFSTHIITIFTDGTLSVWIFWLLSAYVISIAFFKPNVSHNRVLIGAFTKRYVRLCIPVFFSVLLAYVLLKLGLMYNKVALPEVSTLYSFEPDILQAIKSALFTTFFTSEREPIYNSVLWTIRPEFLGSIFIFGLFGIVRHNIKRYSIYLVIMLVLLALNMLPLLVFVIGYVLCDYDFSPTENKFILKLKRIENHIHEFKIIIFILSFLVILFSHAIMNLLHISYGHGCIFLSLFILYVCLRNDYYKRIFSSKIPYWLGKVSFSLYLIHIPIICSFSAFMIFEQNNFKWKVITCIITIIITLPLAEVYTRYIDKTAVSLSNRLGDYFKRYS